MERAKEREEAWSFDGVSESKRAAARGSEENKENLIVNSELKDDLLVYQDEEALNDSIISGAERWEPAGRGGVSTRGKEGWGGIQAPGGRGGQGPAPWAMGGGRS